MLRLFGELDPIRVDTVRDEIRSGMLGIASGADFELDCAELVAISPEGIYMLLMLGREFGKRVVLTGATDACRQRIRMMGLESEFEFR
jgi:STAS domain-containing protein